jgi:hypothetical protein
MSTIILTEDNKETGTDYILRDYPHHQNQFACQATKSFEIALYSTVKYSKTAVEHKEVFWMSSLITEKALDKPQSNQQQKLLRHGTEPIVCK